MVKAAGFGEPALFRFHGDAIEAKIALGDRHQAQALLNELEQLGAVLQRTWVLAVAGRCRGLLSAARGDLDTSYRALERALELHHRLGEPFERARTLLALAGNRPLGEVGVTVICQCAPLGGEPRSQLGA